MKIKKILALLLAFSMLLGTMLLCSCGAKLVLRDGDFYCSKNRVTYVEVDYKYSPVSISKEKFADLEELGKKTELFSLENVDSNKWLATADGRLFCAKGQSVPTLDDMDIDKVLICRDGENMSVSLAEITDETSILTVLENISSGSELEYPVVGEATELLSLRLSSEKYPWLYYNLSYVEFVDDVVVVDYPEDLDSYTYRDTDPGVKVTTTRETECWYIAEDSDEAEMLRNIAKDAGVLSGSVTKPDGNNGTVEYVGLFFSAGSSVNECIEMLISTYTGSLTHDQIRETLASPEIFEEINIVEYNYGKYLIHDKTNGRCVKADQIIHEYKEHIRNDG